MYSINNVLFSYFILLCIFMNFFVKFVKSFTPEGRDSHSSIIIDSKLYFFGGVISSELISNEVFYLDLLQPIDVNKLSWNDITPNASIPFGSVKAMISNGGINNENIFLIGGHLAEPNTHKFVDPKSDIYIFDHKLKQWSFPAINNVPIRRRNTEAVSDGFGRVYIFGGTSNLLSGAGTAVFLNE